MSVLASGLSRDVFPLGERRETVLNVPSEAAKRLPFYWELPTDHLENIKWRLYCRERCIHDHEFRANIQYMCGQDVCFFAETFGIFFEPRPPRPLPIKLWMDQVDVLAWFQECHGKRDLALEKSRGIGASWLMALFVYHQWLFVPEVKIGMVSKDEAGLDTPDSNSLLGKVAYLHTKMPSWMVTDHRGRDIMKRVISDHSITNTKTDATIQGFVPTDNKVRSMRFTSMWFDEFAFLTRDTQANMNASVHTCPSRFFISTWNGSDNLFHTICRREKSTCLVCSMYWWNNSERYKGAYTTTPTGSLKVLDATYEYPKDYPFVLDGLLRSPWVDFELRRAGNDMQSALEELFGLQAESGRKLIRAATINVIETTIRQPSEKGFVEKKDDGYKFRTARDGVVWLFAALGDGQLGPFSAGCDLSFGKGASYSTLEIVDLSTGEQVLEFATNEQNPVEFAQTVFAILSWINGKKGNEHTYLSFENNGTQGSTFCKEIRRLGYGNIMRRQYAAKVSKREESQYYGMRNTDGGLSNLSEVERAVLDGELTIRSPRLCAELGEFNKDEKGKPVYPDSAEGHGDLSQGMGIAWVQARERLVDDMDDGLADHIPMTQELARAEIMHAVGVSSKSWSESWTLPSRNFSL